MAVFVTIECQDCSNGAGYCDYSTSYLRCYFNNNDTQSIKALLTNCASNSSSFSQIYVYKNYVSNEHANPLVDIELPSNIRHFFIYNNRDQNHIRLTTSSLNTALTNIYTDASTLNLYRMTILHLFSGLRALIWIMSCQENQPVIHKSCFSDVSFECI